uniref:Uncharacterized protein n=1 Tax=viral metagenome TaxID=1070528 RepID=A0A6M3LIF8_9ZZZZ
MNYNITYGFSDGQGPFTDSLPAQDIQVALYQFARKHPAVGPENINKIEQEPRDPLGQIKSKKPSFEQWRWETCQISIFDRYQLCEVIKWIEDTRP